MTRQIYLRIILLVARRRTIVSIIISFPLLKGKKINCVLFRKLGLYVSYYVRQHKN